jgi:hypothetical protein
MEKKISRVELPLLLDDMDYCKHELKFHVRYSNNGSFFWFN